MKGERFCELECTPHLLFVIFILLQIIGKRNERINSGLFLFFTGQVEKCVEDVEALCISSLNKFVGVHFSDLRAVDTQ